MLFMHLPTPAIAGNMAAKLFTVQTGISAVCGLILLMLFRSNKAEALVDAAHSATLFVVGGVLMALLAEFGVAPHIVARENLALWHGVGTGMYVVQWLCATAIFRKLSRNA